MPDARQLCPGIGHTRPAAVKASQVNKLFSQWAPLKNVKGLNLEPLKHPSAVSPSKPSASTGKAQLWTKDMPSKYFCSVAESPAPALHASALHGQMDRHQFLCSTYSDHHTFQSRWLRYRSSRDLINYFMTREANDFCAAFEQKPAATIFFKHDIDVLDSPQRLCWPPSLPRQTHTFAHFCCRVWFNPMHNDGTAFIKPPKMHGALFSYQPCQVRHVLSQPRHW